MGADRIVNSVAAFDKYGGPCIVVDFGTAINFDADLRRAANIWAARSFPASEFRPKRFFARAARLLRVEIKDPGKVIGTNTVASHAGRACFTATPIWWTASSTA